MAEKFLEPQNPLKKIDETTGEIAYIYPLTTAKQVIMDDDGTRLNAVLKNINPEVTADKVMMTSGLTLQETIGAINRIDFTDAEGNPTDEPYIHWYIDSETGEPITYGIPQAEEGEF